MGNLVPARNHRRYGNHCSILPPRHSDSNEVDTVGLFHSNHDDSSTVTTHISSPRPSTSIFTLDGIRSDVLRDPATLPSPRTGSVTLSVGDVTPLDNRYRYHLFFCHHERDSGWVEWAVGRLESGPFDCSCCLASRDFDPSITRLQNVLCSVMLSRRIVFVVSTRFIDDWWLELEDGLTQMVFQGHGKNRIMTVILEDCVGVIPDLLRMELVIDARQDPKSEAILKRLVTGGVSYSQSIHTIKSLSIQSYVDYNNGQLLADVSGSVDGFCHPRIRFNIDDIPDLLGSSDADLSRSDYQQIIRTVSGSKSGVRVLPWVFSAIPSVLLVLVFVLWCCSFMLIILLYPDDEPSTLPVRLCVFCLPAFVIVLGCVLRWRRLKQLRNEYAAQMFENSMQINKLLFSKNRPLLVTAGRTREDLFHIYFVFFDLARCLERTQLFLTYCTQEDLDKLTLLVAFHTPSNCSDQIEASTVPERLVLMLCSSFALSLVLNRIPDSLEQRHTRQRQCLCQFLEEFLVAYLTWARRESNPEHLKHVFLKYLNRRLKPDSCVLNSLGITVIET